MQHDLLAGLVLDRQLDPALDDDEHRVAGLAGAEQHLTRLDLTIDHRLREHRALVVIERREQTDLGQERWVDRHAPRISGSLPPCLDGIPLVLVGACCQQEMPKGGRS